MLLDAPVFRGYHIKYPTGRRIRLPSSIVKGDALMIRNAIQRFMYGRYGTDQLNLFLICVYLLLYLVFAFTRLDALYWVSFVLLLWSLFRMLSRNLTSRRAENVRFLRAVNPLMSWLRLQRTIRRDKEHVYFKCPSCGQQLRVPLPPGEGEDHRHLPRLRRKLPGKKLNDILLQRVGAACGRPLFIPAPNAGWFDGSAQGN